MPLDPATATEQDMQDALTAIVAAADLRFAVANPGRLGQLYSSVETAQMALGYLFHETPYVSTNPF